MRVLLGAGAAVSLATLGLVGALVAGHDGKPNQKTIREQCETTEGDGLAECLAEKLTAGVPDGGLPEAMYTLHELAKSDTDVGPLCHDISHRIAQRVYGSIPLREILKVDDTTCLWGLQHGALEAFGVHADETRFWEELPSACGGIEPGSELRNQCGHGLGHAISVRQIGDVYAADSACWRVEAEDVGACVGAVLMAYSTGNPSLIAEDAVELPKVPVEEVAYMCTKFTAGSQRACWGGFWSFYPAEYLTREKFEEVALGCQRAGEYHAECSRGVGEMTVFRGSGMELDASTLADAFNVGVDVCEGGELDPRSCISGVSYAAMNRWIYTLNDLSESIPDLCSGLDGEKREGCLAGREQIENIRSQP